MTKQRFTVDIEMSDHDADLLDAFPGHLTMRFDGTAYRISSVNKVPSERPYSHLRTHREQQIANRVADEFATFLWVSRTLTNGAGTATIILHDTATYEVKVTETKSPPEVVK
jgi:hypothetical protein